jgi:hypothetical protein
MYIVILNKDNRVIKYGNTPFKGLSNNVAQYEVESVPRVAKGQYLTYENGNFVANDIVYTEEQKEQQYNRLVNDLIRKKYSQAQVEAILNNYLTEPTNTKYIIEFNALQEFRKVCKANAKTQIGM